MENVLWNCGKWENLDVGQTWSAMASSTFSLSQEGRHDVQSACPVRIWNLLPPSNSHHSSEVKKSCWSQVAWKTLENHWPSWFSLFLHYFKLTFGAHVVVQTQALEIRTSHLVGSFLARKDVGKSLGTFGT